MKIKKNSRSFTITLTKKKPSIGHRTHRGGSGSHDSRPRKQRTRFAQKQQAIRESY